MGNISKESFYLNQISKLDKSTEHYSTYKVLPEYGEGTYTIYRLIPGLSLSFNNFSMNGRIMNQGNNYQLYSKSIIKINYCLKGKMLAYNKNGKVCISGENTTSYYYGRENIYSAEHFTKWYESITLFGYLEDIKDTFQSVFNIDGESFSRFSKIVNSERDFIVTNTEAKSKVLLNGIKEAFDKGDNETVKLKALELLLDEIKNIDSHKNKKQLYYNQSTVEKLKKVESYIVNHLDEKMTISQLSQDFDIPIDTLKRGFKQLFFFSIYTYIKSARLERGKELLRKTDKGIAEIALMCGYNNHHSFSKAFKEKYSVTPRDSRKAEIVN